MKTKLMVIGAVVAAVFGAHVNAYYRMHHHHVNTIAHHAPAAKEAVKPTLLASR